MKITDLMALLHTAFGDHGDLEVYVTAPSTDSDGTPLGNNGIAIVNNPQEFFRNEIGASYPTDPILYLDSTA